ncbi:MAG TPA: HAMP domain-containing histidine kinase [Bacteroidetes bacterium]|nr:HAMP domain-containing histidine kinase [Bacteroidota bacterium]
MLRSNARLLLFAFIAVLITAGSLLYSNHLARQLLTQEQKHMELFAKALEFAGDLENNNCEVSWVSQNVIQSNEQIPTILVMNDQVNSTMNLGLAEDLDNDTRVAAEYNILEDLKSNADPAPIIIPFNGQSMYIYYDESPMLKKLRFYPYLMLLVIVVFISIVFGSFFIAKKNEQNKVWVGMAKETAHQLGTPVSSLMAWVELLELKGAENPEDLELVEELKKDVDRLRNITERFSKIGSVPELEEVSLSKLLDQAAGYLRKRMPKKVIVEVLNEIPEDGKLHVNEALFEWVIENLLKNALDAIKDKGTISIHAFQRGRNYIIEVSDTGKGIPKHQWKSIFKPGFTTKKRGWGLGLTLTKRVVENYHKGKIFVSNSELGKGTTFRVVLPR